MEAAEPRRLDRLDAALAVAWGAAGLGLSLVAWFWQRGGRANTSDEFAYLFQARTFALGRLTNPTPPLPEFFEVAHQLVTPTWCAKYFPGAGLVLAPFARAGVTWLGPCLLCGATVAMLYLALRLADLSRPIALVAAALYLTSGANLRWWSSYLSQPASTAASVGCFLAAVAFARGGRLRWLCAASACACFAGLCRPLTGLALVLVGGGWLAVGLLRRRLPARAALAALAPLLLAAAFALLFFHATTGDALLPPWTLWARQYAPADGPGFGPRAWPMPLRALPRDLAAEAAGLALLRKHYTLEGLPEDALSRLSTLLEYFPHAIVVLFAALGSLRLPRALRLPGLACAALFVLQLGFFFSWSPYFMELYPWLCAAAACGAAFAFTRLAQLGARLGRWGRLAAPIVLGVCGALAASGLSEEWTTASARLWQVDQEIADAQRALAEAGKQHALVFVRLRPVWASSAVALLQNFPDLAAAPAVVARDLGPRNAELRALFPDRPAMLYDESTRELRKLP